jgi:hypothetical protein
MARLKLPHQPGTPDMPTKGHVYQLIPSRLG